MPGWLVAGFVVGVFVAVLWMAARSREIFALELRDGRVVRARGRLSAELRGELEDVVARARCSGRLAVRVEGGAAVVHAPELDEATRQRARNVVGRFPLARLRTAPRLR